MKSKKNLFFFILFLFVFSSFLFIFKKDFLNIFNTSKSSFAENIKSSCRTVPQKSALKSNWNRMQKLNRLMDTAIDWVFTDLNGEVIDLYCLRGKKKVVLNFWATWCPPCIKELVSLAQLAKDNKEEVFVVAISSEDKNTVQGFLTRSFSDLDPALAVAVVSDLERLKYFPKDSLPATYIFNTKGFLKMKELGDRDWSDRTIVQSILSLD
ncbi:MAG: TlpA disulfide reductase family protein [Oligoflexia bacterium]|nr:TlpA disulfide reductase family protein [Oligoflexia bacterium]